MIAELLSADLATIQLPEDREPTPWSVCRTRKDQKCADCGEYIPKGSDAFRPVGNGMGRWRRLHVGCVMEAVRLRRTQNLKGKGAAK